MKDLPCSLDIPEIGKAWFAGFFDADGNVSINYGTLRCEINLRSSDRRVQERFAKVFGGSFYLRSNNCIQWYLNSLEAVTLLYTILPYLRLKKTEAQVGISFWQRYSDEKDKSNFSERCQELLSTLRYSIRELDPLEINNETSKAYLAGLFDGDGSLSIRHYKGQDQYLLLLSIAGNISTGKQLEQLKSLFGGIVSQKQNTRGVEWQITSRKAEMFLEVIASYIFLKSEQVSFAQEYLKKRKALPHHGRGEKSLLGKYYKQIISNLNQRKVALTNLNASDYS